MAQKTFQITLEQAFLLAPSVKHFIFTVESEQSFGYVPGQFITLLLPLEDKLLRRSYSLASIRQHPHKIEFAVSQVTEGAASEKLFALQPGEQLEAMGPFGRLILPDRPEQRFILLATGTGVTPYRTMLPVLAQKIKNDGSQVILIFGVRTAQDLLYAEDFFQFARAHSEFLFIPCLSQEAPPATLPNARHGYVQAALQTLSLDNLHDVIYLCGNPNMIDQVVAMLTGMGFPSQRLKREKYISSN